MGGTIEMGGAEEGGSLNDHDGEIFTVASGVLRFLRLWVGICKFHCLVGTAFVGYSRYFKRGSERRDFYSFLFWILYLLSAHTHAYTQSMTSYEFSIIPSS